MAASFRYLSEPRMPSNGCALGFVEVWSLEDGHGEMWCLYARSDGVRQARLAMDIYTLN